MGEGFGVNDGFGDDFWCEGDCFDHGGCGRDELLSRCLQSAMSVSNQSWVPIFDSPPQRSRTNDQRQTDSCPGTS